MTVHADYDLRFFRRFLWIALGCVVFSLWFLFDGMVAYPKELERCATYWQPADQPGRWQEMERSAWLEIAQSKNWSTKIPEKPDVQREKITKQYVFSVITFLIAVPCLLKWLLARGTWVESTGKSIRASWGPEFNFDQVVSINKSKWVDKGIAKVRYRRNGRLRTFVLDDFKYHREPMEQIIRDLEATLSDAQITGGQREAEPGDTQAPPPDNTARQA